MRLYHLVSTRHGLENLRKRRLKISQIGDLNDPFELLGASLRDKPLRIVFERNKAEFAERFGMLCFSKNWSNPVLWSHYADKHRGLCLGFDMPDQHCVEVEYTAERFAVEAEKLLSTGPDENFMRRLLRTKFAHWEYEKEVRSFLRLEETDPETGLYFSDFSDELRLKQVIVGARSNVSRDDLSDALGDLQNDADAFKARLAFKSFLVVQNKNQRLWK